MSGIGAACAGGKKPPPPVYPFQVSMDWTGSSVVNVSSASGATGGSNRFVHTEYGGVQPYQNEGLAVLSNPSGKLGLTSVGTGVGVSWSGLAVGESASITVQFYATDAVGNSRGPSDSVTIYRVS